MTVGSSGNASGAVVHPVTKHGKVLTADEIRQLARDNLNEIPEQRDKDIKYIKKWIKSQPHLKENGKTDDRFILNFLRGCKFSYARTKQKIDTWHTVRTHCPELFDNWNLDDPEIKYLIEQGVTVPMPGYDKEGRKVLINRCSYIDVTKHSLEDMVKVMLMTVELLMHVDDDEQVAVKGVVVITDHGGSDANLIKRLSPAFGKKVVTICQDGYPANPKENHMINLPPIMDKLCQLVVSFCNQKVRDRTRFHAKGSDYSVLHEALGKEVLPQEYGGTAGPIQLQIDGLKNMFYANKKWVGEQSRYRSNEKKRQGSQKTFADVFGMEGSFRQLEFD